MIRKITLFVFLYLGGSSLFSTSLFNSRPLIDAKVITLMEQEKSTRKGTVTTVSAILYDCVVTVTVGNYCGDVSVHITGSGGIIQQSFQINDNGECVVDISALGEGLYYIQVILDGTLYDGYFEY